MEELSRKQKKSHDHRFTTWLKNIIFGIVMIAPFLSVMARTIYVQSNQNAMESYYGETINQTEYTHVESLQINNNYLFNNDLLSLTNTNGTTTFYISNFSSNNLTFETTPDRFLYYSWPANSTTERMYMQFRNGTQTIDTYQLQSYTISFSFTLLSITKSNELTDYSSLINSFYLIENNNYSYLDNAFEYSINQLHNVNVYNWSKNTAIYTAIDNMTSGLGMGENNTLALLLAYWSILTAVYIVFDIIIFCFTKITHFINSD